MLDIAVSFLKKAEGFRANAYYDSGRISHVGYGRNISSSGIGWNGEYFDRTEDFNKKYPNGIDERQADTALREDIQQGVGDARRLVTEAGGDWEQLSAVRQAVLVSAAFNLGYPRFKRFAGVWRAIGNHDHGYVAIELLDSVRARQVKRRAALEAIAYLTDEVGYLELSNT